MLAVAFVVSRACEDARAEFERAIETELIVKHEPKPAKHQRQKRGRQDVVDFGANRGRGGSRWAMIIGVLIVAALVIGVVGLIILT